MGTFPNPPIVSGTPNDGDVVAFSAALGEWVPVPQGVNQAAVNASVNAAVNALVNGAPGALDTLKELADAINDDASFAATVTAALAGKQPLDADLTAIAALVTTSFGRSLLTQADAAAVRTAIGAQQSGSSVTGAQWTARTLTGAGTAAAGDFCFLDTTSATFAVAAPSPAVAGTRWGAKWIAGTAAPTLTGTFNGTPTFTAVNQVMQFVSNGTAWYQAERPALAELPDYPTITDLRYPRMTDAIAIPARARFAADTGSAGAVFAATGSGDLPALQMNDATTVAVSAAIRIPTGVTRVNIEVLLAPSGTAVGNFRLRADLGQYADTDTPTSGRVTGTSQSVASSAVASKLFVATMETNVTVDATKLIVPRLVRFGSDALDTCTDNLYFIEMRLRPV